MDRDEPKIVFMLFQGCERKVGVAIVVMMINWEGKPNVRLWFAEGRKGLVWHAIFHSKPVSGRELICLVTTIDYERSAHQKWHINLH